MSIKISPLFFLKNNQIINLTFDYIFCFLQAIEILFLIIALMIPKALWLEFFLTAKSFYSNILHISFSC
ncbi:hypothetical protein DMB45_09395 [Sanguibacteroides justesenii]|nr:hypothetical protein DMB45_09395 [Sanguibacteroides justesenii]